MAPLKILLVVPHDRQRHLAKTALEKVGFRVVAQADCVEQVTCKAFLRRLEDLRPAVAVIAEDIKGDPDAGAQIGVVLDLDYSHDIALVSWSKGMDSGWALFHVTMGENELDSAQMLSDRLLHEIVDLERYQDHEGLETVHVAVEQQLIR